MHIDFGKEGEWGGGYLPPKEEHSALPRETLDLIEDADRRGVDKHNNALALLKGELDRIHREQIEISKFYNTAASAVLTASLVVAGLLISNQFVIANSATLPYVVIGITLLSGCIFSLLRVMRHNDVYSPILLRSEWEPLASTPVNLEMWVINYQLILKYYEAIERNDTNGVEKRDSLATAIGFLLAEFVVFSLGIIRAQMRLDQVVPVSGLLLLAIELCIIGLVLLLTAIIAKRAWKSHSSEPPADPS